MKIGFCGGFREEAAAAAEFSIFEAKICSVGLGSGVLSWEEEGKVCNYDQVKFGLEDGVEIFIFNAQYLPEDLEGGRVYLDRWQVLLAVATELEAESGLLFLLTC